MKRRYDTGIGLALAWAHHRGEEVYVMTSARDPDSNATFSRWSPHPDGHPQAGGAIMTIDRGPPIGQPEAVITLA